MSGSTSQASARFDANSAGGIDLGFKGAVDLLRTWRDGLTPDPELTVSGWADSHRVLSPRGANEAGPWRTSRTPYLREIMDALSPMHPAQRVVVMKGAQIGATETGSNWIGYVIHHAPGPMLAVQPTVELAKRFSQQRIDPLIDESPVLRCKVAPARSRDCGNTVLSKEFPGGILVMTGANTAVGLRSMPVRFLFLDEVDAYPPLADEEGEPVALAEARTRTFSWRRKVFLVSTPTVKGLSRIEREFEASDLRRFFLPCPLCGAAQWLKFERLRWEWGILRPSATSARPATAASARRTRRRAVEQDLRRRAARRDEDLEQLAPDALRRPADEAVVQGLARTVTRRRVDPAPARLQDMDDAADHPAIVHPRHAARLFRQQWRQPSPLDVAQPEFLRHPNRSHRLGA